MPHVHPVSHTFTHRWRRLPCKVPLRLVGLITHTHENVKNYNLNTLYTTYNVRNMLITLQMFAQFIFLALNYLIASKNVII